MAIKRELPQSMDYLDQCSFSGSISASEVAANTEKYGSSMGSSNEKSFPTNATRQSNDPQSAPFQQRITTPHSGSSISRLLTLIDRRTKVPGRKKRSSSAPHKAVMLHLETKFESVVSQFIKQFLTSSRIFYARSAVFVRLEKLVDDKYPPFFILKQRDLVTIRWSSRTRSTAVQISCKRRVASTSAGLGEHASDG